MPSTLPWQGSLLDLDETPSFGEISDGLERITLGLGAWVDIRPGWLHGADSVFELVRSAIPWQADTRVMWDNVVAVPRLTKYYSTGEPLPLPLLTDARDRLSAHYRDELGEDFTSAGCCLYRDGRDSVAWHGDTVGRGATHDTMVAILSLGSARTLTLRKRGGGHSAYRLPLGHGDLAVMGGSCQRTWEHAIPKTAKPVGPRISIQFRTRGVR
ncbi:MAG: alpha-ketoglutarate-dependent dioxygenase AlkB [Dermatophilaceae bacterium]|jgi:alkylated DNA repair dioxygenase AlkB|nr:alpha-ketoglutarate-dependent dioxygenase AlkB [Dermatophilaceae bacterium]MBP9919259.1 alpha-ketoglutarate-dependent dioxygenase AlkB [Dermatophilaceae bacterium]